MCLALEHFCFLADGMEAGARASQLTYSLSAHCVIVGSLYVYSEIMDAVSLMATEVKI